MSDYERGYYYGLYRKRVQEDQMLSQKIFGITLSVLGILLQIMVGLFEFSIMSAWIVAAGIFLIVTKKNYVKE